MTSVPINEAAVRTFFLEECMKAGSTVAKCKDCGGMFDTFSMQGKWCEDCFEIGLHKDMNDHFKNFIEQEMKDLDSKELSGE